MTDSRKFSLGVVLASATMTVMSGSIIAPVLNKMRDGLGVAPSSVGLIITTHGLFMALFSPLMGIIIDRKGVKRPYIIGLIAYGLSGGAGILINSYWVLLATRAFLGIALASIFTAIMVWILNTYEGTERDKIMGWRGSAQSLGGTIWPFIGGALGGLSWHLPFAVYMLGIPIGMLAIVAIPETRPRFHQEGQPTDPTISMFKILKENPVLFIIYGLMFFTNLLLYVVVIFLPQLLESIGISSTFQIGLFLTVQALAGGITAFCYGAVRSRLSYQVIVMIAAAFWSVALASLSLGTNTPMITSSVTMFGIANGLMMPSAMVWLGSVVPPSFRGRLGSYLGTLGFIGQFLSPILFAPVLALLGLKGVFRVGAGIGAAWFLLLLFGTLQNKAKK
jgi:ACDE family multidrug resistance protein